MQEQWRIVMEPQERGIVAKLEFPLPECREEFEAAVHALDYRSVLWDLDQWLRNKIKHGSEHDEATLEVVRKYLHECLDDHNLNLLD